MLTGPVPCSIRPRWVHEFVSGQAESIIGHGYERFVGYLTTLALFILVMNLIGLVPGLESPTGVVVVPLGIALVTFFYYHYHGIRENGFGYIKQFSRTCVADQLADACRSRSSLTSRACFR